MKSASLRGSAESWLRLFGWSIWSPVSGRRSVQPDAVKQGLATHPLYHFAGFAGYGWLALVVVAVLVARLPASRSLCKLARLGGAHWWLC